MSDLLQITISISPYLLGTGKVHLNILDGNGRTLIDNELNRSLVISDDFIDIIHPISRILRKLRDELSYDFEEKKPMIEFNIAFDEKNNIIRHIGIDNLSRIQGEFYLEDTNLKKVSIYNTHYKNDISIDEIHVYGTSDSVEIRNLHIHKLHSSSPSDKFYIGYSQVDEWSHATLTTEIEKHGFWSFEKTTFGKIEFISNKPLGDIFSQIDFYQCEFRGKFLLRKINIETTLKGVRNVTKGLCFNDCTFNESGFLRILQSDIKFFQCIETLTQGIELSDTKIRNVFIYQSSLEKLSIIGGELLGFYNLDAKSGYSTGSLDSSQLKELYRQLKSAHDSIGNKTEANKFFAKEMEYYRKSLTWRDLDKKAISLLQELSNNYGNSWIYPLGWIYALSALKTYFSGLTIHVESYEIFLKEFCIFSERLVLNINLIDDFKGISNPLEFIYRLLLAFFIYQFLIALRRISQR